MRCDGTRHSHIAHLLHCDTTLRRRSGSGSGNFMRQGRTNRRRMLDKFEEATGIYESLIIETDVKIGWFLCQSPP